MTELTPQATVSAGSVRFGNHLPLALIAGPCAMESRDHTLFMAEALAALAAKLGIGLVFKASFDKANRTSLRGARGIGLDAALEIFSAVKDRFGLPVLTDVHDAAQCAPVAEVVDILQIPAFLCRQTDLLVAAARASTGTYSRCPPDEPPCPPGCCTEWVASKITGAPVFAISGKARMSLTSVL